VRHYLINLGARLDDARPPNHAGDAIAAFPTRVLFSFERGRAAVGPRKDFSAVVGRIEDNRVISDAEVVKLLEQFSDHAIVLNHTVGRHSQTGLAFRLGLKMREDMHATRIEPAEEGPVGSGILFDE
jgi:hypothetical protein